MKNQTLGIEIEMASITRARVALVIADHFGTTPKHVGGTYDAWEAKDEQGRTWQVVSDASIRDTPDKRSELVSPILSYEDMPTLQELVRKLRKAGAVSNPAKGTGIHCHIGLCDHTPQTIRNLVNIMAAKEDLLTEAFDIDLSRQATYCRKVDTRFLEQLNKQKPQSMEQLKRLWYNGRDESHIHYSNSRYRMLNLHSTFTKGTLEFRFQNGTLHAGQIRTFVLLCLAMSDLAKRIKTASPKKTESANRKYAMRTWLLRLGFIGQEFENPRKWLLKNLEGDSAFATPRSA